jgi:hypothetical protein
MCGGDRKAAGGASSGGNGGGAGSKAMKVAKATGLLVRLLVDGGLCAVTALS